MNSTRYARMTRNYGQEFDRSFAGLFGSKQSANNFQYEKLVAIREKMKV